MHRWLALALLAATTLVASSAASSDPPANEFQLAVGYAAKETCSCAFVEGESDTYCTAYGTKPTGLAVTIAIDHTANTVTASYSTASRVATFTAGKGCVLAGL